MSYIYDLGSNSLLNAEITLISNAMPEECKGWQFDWESLLGESNSKTYKLHLKENQHMVEGVLHLKLVQNMLVMNAIELAPRNVGSTNKKFDWVAGCLIAFACRESFKLEGDYKGYLTFTSKTDLIEWYKTKYGAIQAIGQRMYFDENAGLKLIDKYLNNE